MTVTITNLTDSVSFAADNIRCYLDTEDMDANTVVVSIFAGLDEQVINALEDLDCTDCRITFQDTPEAESALYLDCVGFGIYDEGCRLVITGEDLRWA